MATTDTLLIFAPQGYEPPTSNFATLDLRQNHPVLDFDATTDEEAVWKGVLPIQYAGGGLTIKIHASFTSATSGNVVWQAAIERVGDEVLDIDSDSFAAFQTTGAVAAPTTSGLVKEFTVTFTSGSQMDSLVAGEAFRLKVRRDADDTSGTDTVTGDAELWAAEVRET